MPVTLVMRIADGTQIGHPCFSYALPEKWREVDACGEIIKYSKIDSSASAEFSVLMMDKSALLRGPEAVVRNAFASAQEFENRSRATAAAWSNTGVLRSTPRVQFLMIARFEHKADAESGILVVAAGKQYVVIGRTMVFTEGDDLIEKCFGMVIPNIEVR